MERPPRSPTLCVVLAGAGALAALSLLLPWALAFDPQMWLVWGREVGRLALDTSQGPSWKPLPVLATTPLAPLGDPLAPLGWLLIARVAALMAVAGAYALAWRIAGPIAGAVAALSVVAAAWWLPNAALGNSEGLLAALLLWAGVAMTDRRRTAALALLACAGLLRPEVWPLFGLFGLWLWRRDAARRPLIGICAALTVLLWTVPPWLGGSGPLGASSSARGIGSDELTRDADHPALTLLHALATETGWPAIAAAAVAAALAIATIARGSRRREDVATAALAAAVAGWLALVIVMTLGGYGGNPRYLVAAAAGASVLAGIGATRAATLLRLPMATALVVPAAVLALSAGSLRDWSREIAVRSDRREALPLLVERAGGRAELLRCAPLSGPGYVRGLLAWELDTTPPDDRVPARGPVTVIAVAPYVRGAPVPAAAPATAPLAKAPGWTARRRCS